jgi:hypothetical protein
MGPWTTAAWREVLRAGNRNVAARRKGRVWRGDVIEAGTLMAWLGASRMVVHSEASASCEMERKRTRSDSCGKWWAEAESATGD